MVGKGGAQLIVTGRGVVHSEMSNGGVVSGLQLWINLHKAHKFVEPEYFECGPGGNGGSNGGNNAVLPTIRCDDGNGNKNGIAATIVMGQLHGSTSPLVAKTPVQYIHYTMGPDMVLDHVIPAHWNVFCYGVSGGGQVDGKLVKAGQTVFWGKGVGAEGLEVVAREAQRVHFGEMDDGNHQTGDHHNHTSSNHHHPQTTRLSTASAGAPQVLILDQQDDVVKWVNGGGGEGDDDEDDIDMMIRDGDDDNNDINNDDGHINSTSTNSHTKPPKSNPIQQQQQPQHNPIPTTFPPTYNPPHNIINPTTTTATTTPTTPTPTTTTTSTTTDHTNTNTTTTPTPTLHDNGVTIYSGPNGFSFILISGEPIYNETVASAGPMLMSTDAEADEAWGDYYDEVNGFEGSKAWKRAWKP